MPPDPHTGTGHRGYGFIVFADPKAGADAVIRVGGYSCDLKKKTCTHLDLCSFTPCFISQPSFTFAYASGSTTYEPLSSISSYNVFFSPPPKVAQMNNFDLLGRPLKVQWANSPQMPPTGIAAPAPPAPPVVLGAPGGGAASGPAAAAAAVTLTAGVATAPGDGNGSGNGGGGYRCTVLENMVTAVEAADPELEGEIKEECSKYGDIETVKVRVS